MRGGLLRDDGVVAQLFDVVLSGLPRLTGISRTRGVVRHQASTISADRRGV